MSDKPESETQLLPCTPDEAVERLREVLQMLETATDGNGNLLTDSPLPKARVYLRGIIGRGITPSSEVKPNTEGYRYDCLECGKELSYSAQGIPTYACNSCEKMWPAHNIAIFASPHRLLGEGGIEPFSPTSTEGKTVTPPLAMEADKLKATEIINTSATADDCEHRIAEALSEAREQGLLEAAEIVQGVSETIYDYRGNSPKDVATFKYGAVQAIRSRISKPGDQEKSG